MNILVTGGAGFIGSHLTKALLRAGHDVVVLDNSSTAPKELHKARLAMLGGKATFFDVDLSDTSKLDDLFKNHSFDFVYHLAARAGVRGSIENPVLYAEANITATIAVLEAAKENGVNHMVIASSSSVYGSNTKTPFSENDPVNLPQSPYAAAKRSVELFAYTYAALHGMNINCMRFFTVYGPYVRPDMAPWIFTERIAREEEIYIFNHGKQKRDFTYIDDIVDGLLAALSYKNGFELFNLGSGNPVGLLYFVELIEKELQKKALKKLTEAAKGDVTQTYADIGKATKLLGYKPKVSVEAGMKKFVAWYKDYAQI